MTERRELERRRRHSLRIAKEFAFLFPIRPQTPLKPSHSGGRTPIPPDRTGVTMALADIFTRPAPRAAQRLTPATAEFGRRPEADGDGLSDLYAWVDRIAELTRPDRIHWVDGSRAENDALLREMVDEG